MSEQDLFNEISEGKAFKDQAGSPANQHAKKIAKEKALALKKEKELSKSFYTVKDGKVLKMTVTLSGVHSEFIKKKSKMKTYESDLKKWKADGEFIPSENISEEAIKIREELEKKQIVQKQNKKK